MPGGRVGGGGHASGGGGGRIGGSFGGGSRGSSFGGSGGFGGSFYPSPGSRPVRDYAPRANQRYNVPHNPRPRVRTIYVGPVYHPGPTVVTTQASGSGTSSGGSSSGSSGIGCMILLLVFMMIGFFFLLTAGNSGSVANSTVQREPLSAGAVNTTGYYEDQVGLINSSSSLQNGMKAFYDQTGVQPFLYVTDTINGSYAPSNTELETFAQQLYSDLFTDSGHFLVILYDVDSEGFGYYYIPGDAAKSVLDSEALEIFESYLLQNSREYYSSPASYFAGVFSATAERIMHVTRSDTFYIGIGIIVLAILGIAYYWWKKAKEKRLKELEMTQQILETDVNNMAKDPTLEDLEQKYSD